MPVLNCTEWCGFDEIAESAEFLGMLSEVASYICGARKFCKQQSRDPEREQFLKGVSTEALETLIPGSPTGAWDEPIP